MHIASIQMVNAPSFFRRCSKAEWPLAEIGTSNCPQEILCGVGTHTPHTYDKAVNDGHASRSTMKRWPRIGSISDSEPAGAWTWRRRIDFEPGAMCRAS